MKFIDFDQHFLPIDCYRNLPEPYRSLAPQFEWKHYDEKPEWWDRNYNPDVIQVELYDERFPMHWKNGVLSDDNGFADTGTAYPGNVIHEFPGIQKNIDEGISVAPQANPENRFVGPYKDLFSYSIPETYDMDKRIKALDRLGIDKAILNPYSLIQGLTLRIDPDLAWHMATGFNDTMTELCAKSDRVYPTFWLPMQIYDEKVLLEMADKNLANGAVGLYAEPALTQRGTVLSTFWNHVPHAEHVWKHANDKKYPVIFHGFDYFYDVCNIGWMQKYRLDEYTEWAKKYKDLFDAIGEDPTEPFRAEWYLQMSVASLIVGGILDRNPDLKMAWIEMGVHRWLYRILETMSQNLGRDCRHYAERFHMSFDQELKEDFEFAVEKYGYERLLFSTDYTHFDNGGRGVYEDVKILTESDISNEGKEKLANKNALRLLKDTAFCYNT